MREALLKESSQCVRISNMETLYSSSETDYITFVVSPDGHKIALTPSGGHFAIVLDKRKSPNTHYKLKDVLGFFWSPNSRYLLFLVLNRLGGFGQVKWGIYDSQLNCHYEMHSFRISNTFGNNYLPFFSQYALSLSFFSPDSEHFVYCDSSDAGVWVSSVKEGSKPKRIASGIFATWSPI